MNSVCGREVAPIIPASEPQDIGRHLRCQRCQNIVGGWPGVAMARPDLAIRYGYGGRKAHVIWAHTSQG